jgi:hypothetical protein
MMTQLATPTRRTVESHDLASRSERGSIENSTLLCALVIGFQLQARDYPTGNPILLDFGTKLSEDNLRDVRL